MKNLTEFNCTLNITINGTTCGEHNGSIDGNTSDCGEEDGFVISGYLWKIVPPILLLVGVTGNILAVIILNRLGLGRQPTLTFLLFLALNDTVVLLTGLPRYWISNISDFDIRRANNATCKLYLFVIYLSMQYSSWILVGVAIERLVKTYFPFRYKRFYTSRKVIVGLLVTLFVLVLVNGHFFFTNGINEYTEGYCSSLNADFFYFDENIFVFIDFAILSVIPFFIMLGCNIFLVRILRNVQRNRATMMHNSILNRANRFSVRMTKMLVVCSFYFLIATAPVSIWFILDSYLSPGFKTSNNCDAQARMEIVWSITYLLQFSNYCINFYLYTALNDRFKEELRNFLCCKTSYRGSRSYTARQGSSTRSLARQSIGSISAGLEENSMSEENRL